MNCSKHLSFRLLLVLCNARHLFCSEKGYDHHCPSSPTSPNSCRRLTFLPPNKPRIASLSGVKPSQARRNERSKLFPSNSFPHSPIPIAGRTRRKEPRHNIASQSIHCHPHETSDTEEDRFSVRADCWGFLCCFICFFCGMGRQVPTDENFRKSSVIPL
ncbi:hypothetical protein V8C44DRAFT_52823 [Trichoderma aethiopicum]